MAEREARTIDCATIEEKRWLADLQRELDYVSDRARKSDDPEERAHLRGQGKGLGRAIKWWCAQRGFSVPRWSGG